MAGLSGVMNKIGEAVMSRLNSVESEAASAKSQAQQAMGVGAGIARWRRVVTSGANGVYTKTFPANFFTTEPVAQITPKMPATNFEWAYVITGSVADGYTITVTFTRRLNVITLLGTLLGTPVAVTFSLSMGDQTDDV